MIIQTQSSIAQQKRSQSFLKIGGIAILLIGLLAVIANMLKSSSKPSIVPTELTGHTLLADAETKEGDQLILNGYKVTGANCQSSDFAYQGDYSLKLSANGCRYGFASTLDNIQVGDKISVKVWAYSPNKEIAHLVISGLDVEELYLESTGFSGKDGWELISVSTNISRPLKEGKIKIYCYNSSNAPIYFDNLSMVRKSVAELSKLKQWEPETIHITVKPDAHEKFKQKRLEALNTGILINSDDSWVKGHIYPEKDEDEKIKVSLRLKGDWTDHLRGDQWSFRVKTETNKAWNRLKTFSLQTPHTRSYLYEWMLHQFFLYEDVLTTRYEFVNMRYNHKDLGLYVYEEHFLKQIPEYNRKKEGPILRFTEAGYWDTYRQVVGLGLDINDWWKKPRVPDIKPFGEKKTMNSPVLKEQYTIAQNLLYQYQYGIKPAADIFDIDILAKYFAIIDLTAAYHSKIWHNQRFYYNSVTSKLEPIGYDGFGDSELKYAPVEPFIGFNLGYKDGVGRKDWYRRLFSDKTFLVKYTHYLEKFSKNEYVEKFIESIEVDLIQRRSYIQREKPDYKFDHYYIRKRAALILNGLYLINEDLHNKTVEPGLIAVCNRHAVPLNIIGTATEDGGAVDYFDSTETVWTTPPKKLPDYSHHIAVPETARYLVCQVIGLEKKYYVLINSTPVPDGFAPVQELVGNLTTDHAAYFYDEVEKRVIFHPKAVVSHPIVIPADHDVIVEAGTTIDITNQAFIMSYSNVQFTGRQDAPILVHSSDKSARAFTVLKASKPSLVRHTTFDQLGAFYYKGWSLPGAVNFYESDVTIERTTFTRNSCEDALNIVRAKFEFIHNIVSHTYGDGFDADFCEGLVSKCYFHNTGNDAIDFSTSKVLIEDCKIKIAGDKGISMGEQGTATIKNCVIDDAVIGIASKDLSKTTVVNVDLKNCKTGFSAYQKKPEYGHGFIYVDSYTSENVDLLHKILPGSYLRLVKQEIKGD